MSNLTFSFICHGKHSQCTGEVHSWIKSNIQALTFSPLDVNHHIKQCLLSLATSYIGISALAHCVYCNGIWSVLSGAEYRSPSLFWLWLHRSHRRSCLGAGQRATGATETSWAREGGGRTRARVDSGASRWLGEILRKCDICGQTEEDGIICCCLRKWWEFSQYQIISVLFLLPTNCYLQTN